jgi:hypothetical protein
MIQVESKAGWVRHARGVEIAPGGHTAAGLPVGRQGDCARGDAVGSRQEGRLAATFTGVTAYLVYGSAASRTPSPK